MQRKTRTLPHSLGIGQTDISNWWEDGRNQPIDPPTSQRVNLGTIYGSQVTDSETHQWPRRTRDYSDVGGDFFTQKKYVIGKPMYVEAIANANWVGGSLMTDVHYHGPIWPLPPTYYSFPAAKISNDSELIALGTTAISRCAPTNAVVNLSTFLTELIREGLPQIPFKGWKEGTRTAKDGGGEFLNEKFGWEPILRDLLKFREHIANANDIFRQYERDAGRVVRRKWEFPVERRYTANTYTDFSSGYYAPHNGWLNRPGRSFQYVQELEGTTKTWFSGAFTYHLPQGYNSRKEMDGVLKKFDRMFSVELTPETVWNAAPWTWAVDWFSSAGDALGNISSWANDGLVMRYGYLMQHNVEKVTYTLLESRPLYGMKPAVNAKISLVTETKIRRRANPFGFGITWDGLSAAQLAILAALGIDRVAH